MIYGHKKTSITAGLVHLSSVSAEDLKALYSSD